MHNCSKSEQVVLSCILLFLMVIPSFAEVEFVRHQISDDPIMPRQSVAADMDNDNDMDILVISGDRDLSWFENLGDDNYEKHTIDRAYMNLIVEAVDLDNDNDMDIVIVQHLKLYVYINDSNQNFTRMFLAGTNSTIESFYIVDLDSDGDQDIVSGQSNDFVFWIENQTTNEFAFTQHIILENYRCTHSTYAKDMNHDGHLDILALSTLGYMAILLNDGENNFYVEPRGNYDTIRNALSLQVADFNNDGFQDFACSYERDPLEGGFRWYENDGELEFDVHEPVLFFEGSSTSFISIGDIDLDGDVDILGNKFHGESFWYFQNDGTGEFESFAINSGDYPVWRALPYDMDYDGDLDILVSTRSNSDGEIFWLENSKNNPNSISLQHNYFEMISTYVLPENQNAENLFGGICDLGAVYQNNGNIFVPGLINNIGEVNATQAYRVFCWEDSYINLEGTSVDPDMQYNLNADAWNWIGYPFGSSYPVEDLLRHVRDDIQVVLTDDGRVWIPDQNVNTLQNMVPGEGYMIFPYTDMTFQYELPENVPAIQNFIEPEYYTYDVTPTGLPYVLFVEMDQKIQEKAALIEVCKGDQVFGQAMVESGNSIPVIVWGGSAEYNVAGFEIGEIMDVRVMSKDGSVIAREKSKRFGEGVYGEIILSENKPNLVSEFAVNSAYPNPFNPSFVLPFTLNEKSQVSFKLFNVLGQELFEFSDDFEAGNHNWVFNKSMLKQDLVSGLYLLKVSSKDSEHIQKVILMK